MIDLDEMTIPATEYSLADRRASVAVRRGVPTRTYLVIGEDRASDADWRAREMIEDVALDEATRIALRWCHFGEIVTDTEADRRGLHMPG